MILFPAEAQRVRVCEISVLKTFQLSPVSDDIVFGSRFHN